jgi:hypothetical protein
LSKSKKEEEESSVYLNSMEDEAEFMQMIYDNDPNVHMHALDKFKKDKAQKSMAYLKSKNILKSFNSPDKGVQTG